MTLRIMFQLLDLDSRVTVELFFSTLMNKYVQVLFPIVHVIQIENYNFEYNIFYNRMNFIKKVFGYKPDLQTQIKSAKFQGTLYRVIKDSRNILFRNCSIVFTYQLNERGEDAYSIEFTNLVKDGNQVQQYVFPIYIGMSPFSFSMKKQGRDYACFEWTLDEGDQKQQHIGFYMDPSNKNQFKDLLCQILKVIYDDQNIKDHLQLCKQLNGIPTYKTKQQSKSQSKLNQNITKSSVQFNDLLIEQAGKKQNKFVHSASCYQIIQKQKKLLYEPIIMVIKSKSQFQYEIQLINQTGFAFIKKQLTSGLHYTINTDEGYLKWLHITETGSKIIQVNFGKLDAALSAKFAIMQCLYEINTKKKVTEAIAEDEYDYMKRISQKPAFSQKLHTQIVKTYEQKQQLVINDEQFNYDSQEVHKGLEKYKNLCQAKINDFQVASLGSMLEVLQISEENQIKRKDKINLKNKKNQQLQIDEILMHDNDCKSLLHGEDGGLYYCDIVKGVIVQQYNPSKKGIQHVCPQFKLAETSNFKTFKAVSPNTIYQIDPRTQEGVCKQQSYATNPNFCKIGVDVKGNFAIGTQSGQIKLYDQIGKKATTRYPALGDPVLNLDSTKDGKLLLATFKNYLLLLPTQTQQGVNLYSTKTKIVQRPYPIKLQIKIQHLQLCKMKLNDLKMAPAKFDQRTNSNERFIISGFGQYVVIWNLGHILNGNIRDYKFTKVDGQVIQADFKFNNISKLIMTTSKGIIVKQNKIQK